MTDYIERQAAISALYYGREQNPEEDIKAIPPANVRPVVKGTWIETDDPRVRCICSACGFEFLLYECDVFGMPYCPNCGASMEQEE